MRMNRCKKGSIFSSGKYIFFVDSLFHSFKASVVRSKLLKSLLGTDWLPNGAALVDIVNLGVEMPLA